MNTHGTLREWLQSHTAAERQQLASGAKTSVAYLYQLAGGHRSPSLRMALDIERGTNGEVCPASFSADSAENPNTRSE